MTAAHVLIPKAQWAKGPWHKEPDQFLFTHAGFPCFIFRNMLVTGSLCGYVALTPEHPWWGKDYSECVETPPCEPRCLDPSAIADAFPELPKVSKRMAEHMAEPSWSCDHRPEVILDVHGGVTYAGPMQQIGNADERPQSFEWGFGFDCAHAGDLAPLMDATLRFIYLSQGPAGVRHWKEHQRIMRPYERYRTMSYVRKQVEGLAEQLAKVTR
jgi:hypothetical protein